MACQDLRKTIGLGLALGDVLAVVKQTPNGNFTGALL